MLISTLLPSAAPSYRVMRGPPGLAFHREQDLDQQFRVLGGTGGDPRVLHANGLGGGRPQVPPTLTLGSKWPPARPAGS
jgi:hypothetical protein